MITKAAVAGGVIWATPAVLTTAAGATTGTSPCKKWKFHEKQNKKLTNMPGYDPGNLCSGSSVVNRCVVAPAGSRPTADATPDARQITVKLPAGAVGIGGVLIPSTTNSCRANGAAVGSDTVVVDTTSTPGQVIFRLQGTGRAKINYVIVTWR